MSVAGPSFSPQYPVAGEAVTCSFTVPLGNATEWEITSVPNTSKVKLGVIKDADGAATATFTPDVAGAYGITGYDIAEWSTPPRFLGDPTAGAHRKIVGVATGTVFVGNKLTTLISAGGHGVTLTITVVNDTVRVATLTDPTSEVARLAALDSTVDTKRAALVGVSSGSLGEAIVSRVADLRAKYEAHRAATVGVMGNIHTAADGANTITVPAPDSVPQAIETLNQIRDRLGSHISRTASHAVGDGKNVPIVEKATDLASAIVLEVDLSERVYERHRVQTASPAAHEVADSGNALAAPKPLSELIVAYLDRIADAAPAAPTGENPGAVRVAHSYGFRARS